ncbi:hypothetical protein [Elizabethkingia ursingii]
MKKFVLAFLPIVVILGSCSDNLSKSKAEKIAKECLEKTPEKKTTNILLGKEEYLRGDSLKIKKLANEGYLKIVKNPRGLYSSTDTYNISLTEKSKPFVESTEQYYSVLRMYDYKIGEIKEIQEVPAMGGANVKIELLKKNKTPFAILDDSNTEFKIINAPFAKTSDGWRWCE